MWPTSFCNALNMIINTEANEQIAQGHHWITVRLERAQNGTIHIHFVDSWPGDADYQELFAGLRVFVAQGQIQNGLQNGLQSTSTPVKKLQN